MHPGDAEDDATPPGWLMDAAALGPEDCCLREEQVRLLRGLIAALPDDKRAVVRLAHEAGMEIGEIAMRLGIPDGTVKSRLHYARKTLRDAWRDLGMEEE
ncbi:MAG: ECF RNA polymerase sigma factor SigW [bacterium ADurb.Bin429]|nr:MAG: ECF RNA polymerase sigma factor SigW [bacterium ADurb.Bin429]